MHIQIIDCTHELNVFFFQSSSHQPLLERSSGSRTSREKEMGSNSNKEVSFNLFGLVYDHINNELENVMLFLKLHKTVYINNSIEQI